MTVPLLDRKCDVYISELLFENPSYSAATKFSGREIRNIFAAVRLFSRAILKLTYLGLSKPWRNFLTHSIRHYVTKNNLAIALTSNQRSSLKWVSQFDEVICLSQLSGLRPFPIGAIATHAMFCLPQLLIKSLFSGKFLEILPWLAEYALYYPTKSYASRLFETAQVKTVIMSNDHSSLTRAVLKAAKLQKVFSIYTQHASVDVTCPPLTFDLSLLDGMHAVSVYQKIGKIVGQVYVTGRMQTPKIEEVTSRYHLGLAANILDSIEVWQNMFELLQNRNFEVKFRCHPGDRRKSEWSQICKVYGIQFSDPKDLSLSDFLRDLKILVASQSNIILDATIHGVASYLYEETILSKPELSDWYGFIEFKIAGKLTKADVRNGVVLELMSREFDSSEITKRAAFYDEGITLDSIKLKLSVMAAVLNNKNSLNDTLHNIFDEMRCADGSVIHLPSRS